MKRCYERENYRIITGKSAPNHCGAHVLINGCDYCPKDGRLLGYVGYCADIKPISTDTQIEWTELQ